VFTERTNVGLDVHARSVAAAVIDGVTGELSQARLTPSHEHIRSWVQDLPSPVAVTYEAGPAGFDLYRCLSAAGIRCEVAAPSKLQKPSGERVKTDANDAIHLARLLRLDQIIPVTVPSPGQEAARAGAGSGGLPRGPDACPTPAVQTPVASRARLLRRRRADRQTSVGRAPAYLDPRSAFACVRQKGQALRGKDVSAKQLIGVEPARGPALVSQGGSASASLSCDNSGRGSRVSRRRMGSMVMYSTLWALWKVLS
jgi:hypothetical protein